MMSRRLRWDLLLSLLCWILGAGTAAAQVFSAPASTNRFGTMPVLDAIQTTRMDSNLFLINSPRYQSWTSNPRGKLGANTKRAINF